MVLVHEEVAYHIYRQHFTVSFLIMLMFLEPLNDQLAVRFLFLLWLFIPTKQFNYTNYTEQTDKKN